MGSLSFPGVCQVYRLVKHSLNCTNSSVLDQLSVFRSFGWCRCPHTWQQLHILSVWLPMDTTQPRRHIQVLFLQFFSSFRGTMSQKETSTWNSKQLFVLRFFDEACWYSQSLLTSWMQLPICESLCLGSPQWLMTTAYVWDGTVKQLKLSMTALTWIMTLEVLCSSSDHSYCTFMH